MRVFVQTNVCSLCTVYLFVHLFVVSTLPHHTSDRYEIVEYTSAKVPSILLLSYNRYRMCMSHIWSMTSQMIHTCLRMGYREGTKWFHMGHVSRGMRLKWIADASCTSHELRVTSEAHAICVLWKCVPQWLV